MPLLSYIGEATPMMEPLDSGSDVDVEQQPGSRRAGGSAGGGRAARGCAKLLGAVTLTMAVVGLALHAQGLDHTTIPLWLEQKWGPLGGHGHDVLAATGGVHPQQFAMKGWMKHRPIIKELKELDVSGDGQLEGAEMDALAKKLQEHFGIPAKKATAAAKNADSNGDGSLEKKEIAALLEEMHREVGVGKKFDKFDQDGNGSVEGDELKELSKKVQEHFGISDSEFQKLLGEADGDGDGKLSRSEAPRLAQEVHRLAAVSHRFDELDKDGNGKVAGDELQGLSKKVEAHFGISKAEFEKAFQAADSNGDGQLEKLEAPALLQHLRMEAMASKRFHRLDHDGNGKLEGKELEEFSEKLQAHFGVAAPEFQAILDAADENADGKLESQEAELFLQELRKAKLGEKGQRASDVSIM